MDKRAKILLMVAALAVAGYLAMRWYENRKSAQNGSTQGDAGLGSNLNSVAPELVGGSTGPSIGPALSTPITINVTSSDTPQSPNPVGDMMQGVSGTTPSPLSLANPDNSGTGAQANAPMPDDMSGAGIASAGTGTTATTPVSSGANQPTSTKTVPPRTGPPIPAVRYPPKQKPITRPGAPKGRPRVQHPQPRREA